MYGYLQPSVGQDIQPMTDGHLPFFERRFSPPVLLQNEVRHLLQVGQQHGLSLQVAQYAPVPAQPQLYTGQTTEVVVLPAAQDPLFSDPDGFPIPKKNLDDLRAVRAAGLEFDDLWIAHELPRGTVNPGRPITAEILMPPPSRKSVETSHTLGKVGGLLWKMAAAPLLIGAGLFVAVAAVPAVVVGLDPIVFGLKTVPGRRATPGELAAWVVLTGWAWNQEDYA